MLDWLGWRWVVRCVAMGLGAVACGGGDDGGGDAADASATAGDDDGPVSASAEDGPEATGADGDGDGSASGSASGSGDPGDDGSDDGPPPAGTCCTQCPDGTMAGDSCSSATTIPPCCTATELFTCEDLQCGSQSCVGTWTAGSCDCTAQSLYYLYLLGQVIKCDPAGGGATCALSEDLVDSCGCAVILDTTSDAIPDAMAAQAAWMEAGCGPMGCGAPCLVDGTPACVGDEQFGYSCTLM